MSFIENLKNNEKIETENGAVSYKTSSNPLVDLNFKVPSFRNKVDFNLFDDALCADFEHTLKWLLYLRDIRNGIGERDSYRELLLYFVNNDQKFGFRFLTLPLEKYGRWDDYIFIAYNTSNNVACDYIIDKISKQLHDDKVNAKEGKPISLLAKWMCSANASCKETRRIGKWLANRLSMTLKEYRKTLSYLRSYLNVIEVKMSNNSWEDIDYSKVPSKANLLYENAFYRHDAERREKYLEDLKNGNTKINANSMFLYDIVHKYTSGNVVYRGIKVKEDTTLEELWKAQNKIEGFTDTLVVRDGSGSMTVPVGNSHVTALDVCNAITIYASENNVGEYKDKFITFSSKPQYVDLSKCNTLAEKIEELYKHDDCSTTNIEKVFDMVLNTAIKNKLNQEDLPKQILIISDMEFNCINDYYDIWDSDNDNRRKLDNTLFEEIADRFNENGYKLPKLVFWNVNSRTNAVPLQKNELGVILVSGFSKNIFDMVLSTELDPYKALVSVLDSGRYDCVKGIVDE